MISKIVGVWTCFFPAKAGPTNGSACIPRKSRQASIVGPALAGELLILIFLRDSSVTTNRDLGAG